jgi:hypothetical protein
MGNDGKEDREWVAERREERRGEEMGTVRVFDRQDIGLLEFDEGRCTLLTAVFVWDVGGTLT